MRPVLGYITLAAAVIAVAPAAVHAQDSTKAEQRAAAQVLDYTFNAPINEPVRLFLAKGTTYQAEVQGKGLRLGFRPLLGSTQLPGGLLPTMGSRVGSASGEMLYTITPRADAEYVITTVGGQPGSSVELRVYAMAPKIDNNNKSGKKP